MLIKNSDLVIEKSDPFQNDCLDRKQQIVELTNLIRTASQPFVLSIEAPWGWGKTTFINLWKSFLEGENQHCLYFNAWENDFADDPLIAFISEMRGFLEHFKNGRKASSVEESLRNVQKIGEKLFKKSLPVILRIATQGIFDGQTIEYINESKNELGKLVESFTEDRINEYEKNKNGISDFKKCFSEFIKQLSDENVNRKPIVFFIDELDRCRPDFALTLLERIKHIFSVEGVVFVLSIDRQQLTSILKSVYGSGIDADGYLRRFIDLRYTLPPPSIKQFCEMLFVKFDIKGYFENRRSNLNYHIDPNEFRSFEEAFIEVVTKFNFSLRSQEQCMTEINVFLRTTGIKYLIHSQLLIFLVAIRSHRPDIYQLLHGKEDVDIGHLLELTNEILTGGEFFSTFFEPFIAANIIRNFFNEDEPNEIINKLRNTVESGNSTDNPTPEQFRARRILEFVNYRNGFFDQNRKISQILNRLDNLGNVLL